MSRISCIRSGSLLPVITLVNSEVLIVNKRFKKGALAAAVSTVLGMSACGLYGPPPNPDTIVLPTDSSVQSSTDAGSQPASSAQESSKPESSEQESSKPESSKPESSEQESSEQESSRQETSVSETEPSVQQYSSPQRSQVSYPSSRVGNESSVVPYGVYGPPPEELSRYMNSSQPEPVEESSSYDPASEIPEELYGPPPFEESSMPETTYVPEEDEPVALYGPPGFWERSDW